MKSLFARLVAAAMQWHPVLTGSGPAAVVVATLFAAAVVVDPYQLNAAHIEDAGGCEAPALLERVKAIDPELVLVAIGEALSPFTE